MYLQDYPVEPHDIDILCSVNEAAKIEKALSGFHIPFDGEVTRDKFRSRFSRYQIDGIDVEVMAGLQVNTPGGWITLMDVIAKIELLEINGKLLKVPSRQDQLKIYQLFGRQKDEPVISIIASK